MDAISLEVFKHRFASVAEEMGVTLQRASLSPNIKERLDFSCAVFDKNGHMVSQAAHIPVHLGSMPASVEYAIHAFGNLAKGDVVILNDPYGGGTHLPDITMVSPVYWESEALFYVASRAHHADVGGMSPGSLPLSTELYQEGLIIPPIKLIDAGQLNAGVLKLITANSRTSDERLGDIEAQQAAHRVGEKRLLALLSEFGDATLTEHAQGLQAYSRTMTEALIESIPDGTYTNEDYLEGDGQSTDLIPLKVTLRVLGSQMTVDYSASADQVRGNLNAVPAIVRSATWYAVRLLAETDIPVNDGCFQPVDVITRAGSILNPHFPAGVAVGNTETSQRIVDLLLGALAQALPERIPAASTGSMNNFTFGGTYGGQSFVYYETLGGGHGASPYGDGISGCQAHMTNTLNTPVEAIEMVLPVRIRAYSLCENSGGSGKFRGGDGVKRQFEFLAPAEVTFNTERRAIAPKGVGGGEDGQVGKNQVMHEGETIDLPAKHTRRVSTGDIVTIQTAGGGGYGRVEEVSC